MTDDTKWTCHKCGSEHEVDDEGWAECWGTKDVPHGKIILAKPCANCGVPQSLDLCEDCAEEMPGSAVTPTWGKHQYRS